VYEADLKVVGDDSRRSAVIRIQVTPRLSIVEKYITLGNVDIFNCDALFPKPSSDSSICEIRYILESVRALSMEGCKYYYDRMYLGWRFEHCSAKRKQAH